MWPARRLSAAGSCILDRWSDGSARWVLCDWQASQSGPGTCTLKVNCQRPEYESGFRVDAKYRTVSTAGLSYEFVLPGDALMSVSGSGGSASGERLAFLTAIDASGHRYRREMTSWELLENGPIRTCVRLAGHFHSDDQVPRLFFSMQVHWFAGSPSVRCHLTIGNPFRADHPGGLWDLGAESSFFLRELSFQIRGSLPAGIHKTIWHSSENGNSGISTTAVEIYQDSSGGPNWHSSNHLNRNRIVPNTFRGYRFRSSTGDKTGLRATPIVRLNPEGLAVSMPYFWQNFPKAIEVDQESISLGLYPRQYSDVHELQGGEQKTHVFHVSFGPDDVTHEPLAWTRDPLVPVIDPTWVASTGAKPFPI